MSAEFVVNERLGSMEFGAVSAKCTTKATWSDSRLVNQAYWYSWSGALRDGSSIQGLRKPTFGKGDIIKVSLSTREGVLLGQA